MTSRTRPRINRDRPRPRINGDERRPRINRETPRPLNGAVELAAHREVRRRDRRGDDLNFFNIREVAERLRVSTRTVRRWIENRDLIVHRVGGIRIADGDLRAFLALHREG